MDLWLLRPQAFPLPNGLEVHGLSQRTQLPVLTGVRLLSLALGPWVRVLPSVRTRLSAEGGERVLCASWPALEGRAALAQAGWAPCTEGASSERRPTLPIPVLLCFLSTARASLHTAGLVDLPSNSFRGNRTFRNPPSPYSPSDI